MGERHRGAGQRHHQGRVLRQRDMPGLRQVRLRASKYVFGGFTIRAEL
jgi:hypothetical protein